MPWNSFESTSATITNCLSAAVGFVVAAAAAVEVGTEPRARKP